MIEQVQQPQLQILKLFVKDMSFEIPAGVKAFQTEWQPNLHIEINTHNKALKEENTYEVGLKVKCTVKLKEDVAFIAEVEQAGIFLFQHFSPDPLQHALGVFCPNMLYPYLREVVSDMVLKGGFPQLNLAPVNFEVLYAEQQKRQQGNALQS